MAILYIENTAGKPFDGCPIKINEVSFKASPKGILDLQRLIGKRIGNIEVNGTRQTFHPEFLIQKGTKLRVRYLMNEPLRFQDETEEFIY